jgi:hypothetical protein
MTPPDSRRQDVTPVSRADFARRLVWRLGWVAAGVALIVAFHAGEPFDAPTSGLEAATLRASDHCEVLFIGSSYVMLQVLTEQFDAASRRLGSPLRSCKYGQVGLYGFELRYRLERLLAHDWPKLRVVVIDVDRENRARPEFNWYKARIVEWHSVRVLPWSARRYLNDARGWLEPLADLRVSLVHVALHYAQLGRGLAWLRDLDLVGRLGLRGESRHEPVAMRAQPSQTPPARWLRTSREKLVRERARIQREGLLGDSAWLLEMRDVVRASGTGREVVFVLPPSWKAKPLPRRAVEGEDRLLVLDYLDPQGYAALYRTSSRGFTSHLSPKGSKIWSRLLARDLVAALGPTN